ncbi:MAG: hypothetical protein ACK4NO_00975 [Glycocaulis sp.]
MTAPLDGFALAGVGRADTRVRFCWAMHPVCNLVDESRRPPAPFEIAIER